MSLPSEDVHLRVKALGAERTLQLLDIEQTSRARIDHDQELSLLYEPHRLQASDGWDFAVDVDTNHAPAIDSIQTINRNRSSGTHTVQLTATDPNGDEIVWDKRSGPNFLSVSQSGVLSINTNHSSATTGYHDMRVRARDRRNGSFRGGSDTLDIRVQIIQPNRAPVLQNVGSRTITLGQSITINLLATDADNDTITYTKDVNVGSLDSASGVFTWTPTETGDTDIVFTASDGRDTHSRTASITVNPRPVIPPSPPVLRSIGNRAVVAGNQIRIVLSATDPDDLPITYSKSGSFGVLNDNIFTWTPTTVQTRSITFTATATGGTPANETDSETINIIVSANRPPVLAEIGNRTVRQGATLSIALSASDPENDALEFRKQSGVGSISGSTYTYSPGSATGTKTVKIRVRETANNARYDEETFTITIQAAAATPPTWEDTPNNSTYDASFAGRSIDVDISANDPHNLPITYSVRSNSSHASIRTNTDGTKYVRFRLPAAGSQRTYTIRAQATGGTPSNESVDHTWTATVNDPVIVDSPPTMEAIGNKSTKVNQQLRFTVVATDPDGDTVRYSRSGTRGSIGATSGIFTWTPTSAQTRKITITATAGGKSVSETITITVGALVIPVIDSGPADATLAADQAGSPSAGTINATDPNGRALTFSIVRGNGVISGQNRVGSTSQYSATFRITHPAAGTSETYTIRAAVNSTEYTDHTWTITVSEPDYSPNITITSPPDGFSPVYHASPNFVNLYITATKHDGTKIPLDDLTVTQNRAHTFPNNIAAPFSQISGESSPAYIGLSSNGITYDNYGFYPPSAGNLTITVSFTDTVNNRAYTTTKSITVTFT